MHHDNLVGLSIHSGDVVDWEFLSNKGLAQSFFDSINTYPFSRPQWVNFFQINEPVFCELVREFFASFEFDSSPCRYDPLYKGVTFRLGGVEKEMSLLELGWRVGLYSEWESREVATLCKLRGSLMVNSSYLNHLFWPSIGDDGYNVGNTKAKSIRNPRIRLAHHCLTMTITGRKETTHHVTKINLFYLYCFFREGNVCNIPYWLAKYLKSVREKGIFLGDVCDEDSLGVIMELREGVCCWPATREVTGEGKGAIRKEMEKGETKELGAPWRCDKEGDGEGGNKGVRGSAEVYRNMSQAFPGFGADYPPYGYQRHMPPGYTYRRYPPQDGSS
ncbi:hypothetical protein Tco_1167265 [Tanacetum coccineum]